MKKEDTVELYFPMDGIVNGVVVYEKGKTYSVPKALGSSDRWIIRGAIPQSQMPKKEETVAAAPVLQDSDKQEDSVTIEEAEMPKYSKNNGGKQGKNK